PSASARWHQRPSGPWVRPGRGAPEPTRRPGARGPRRPGARGRLPFSPSSFPLIVSWVPACASVVLTRALPPRRRAGRCCPSYFSSAVVVSSFTGSHDSGVSLHVSSHRPHSADEAAPGSHAAFSHRPFLIPVRAAAVVRVETAGFTT